jgi:hypothetical protein
MASSLAMGMGAAERSRKALPDVFHIGPTASERRHELARETLSRDQNALNDMSRFQQWPRYLYCSIPAFWKLAKDVSMRSFNMFTLWCAMISPNLEPGL